MKVSVVMAVYKNDNPEWVSLAIDSMLDQSRKPDEMVVVVDGPVSVSLKRVLDSYGDRITRIALPENQGLWNALNVGIDKSRYELIARMDADDIALSDRLEKQVAEFEKDPDLELLGGQLIEFEDSIDYLGGRRDVPLSEDDIIKFAKYRSPFNHPTVVYKRASVLRVGGYDELYRTEDYDLWVRMIQAGMRMRNLPDTVLYYRSNIGNIGRKATPLQYRESMGLLRRLYDMRRLSWSEYVALRAARSIFYRLPGYSKRMFYRGVLRSTPKGRIG